MKAYLYPLYILVAILISLNTLSAQSEIELRTDGVVVPRTTATAVTDPVAGMLIYDTDIDHFKMYNGTTWISLEVTSGGGSVAWQDITSKPAGFSDGVDNVNDADANSTNELQVITKKGSLIGLSQGGGSVTDAVDDADASPTNELQTISKSGSVVTLSNSGGSFTDNVNDADASATNELQNLTLGSNGLSLSNSNAEISISSITPWKISGVDAVLGDQSGKVGIGIGTPAVKVDIGGGLRVAMTSVKEEGVIRYNPTTKDFEGYGDDAWKSLTGLLIPQPPPTYDIGEFIDDGVVFWISPDNTTVKLIYYASLGIEHWSTTTGDVVGAESNVDGLQNTLDIINDPLITSVPAQLCNDLNAGGHGDWYLPAKNELIQLWEVRDVVNNTILAYLGDDVDTNVTWSSTEINASTAYTVQGIGFVGTSNKSNNSHEVRAIRTITF